MGLRLLVGLLAIALVLLLARAWLSDVGYFDLQNQRAHLESRQAENAAEARANRRLLGEVEALRNDPEAIEARAREDLGMIREGETFYFVDER